MIKKKRESKSSYNNAGENDVPMKRDTTEIIKTQG
jgi:hypothetical protein